MAYATSALERYQTVSRLGAGGMSTVDLAEDQLLGRRVALKRMHRHGERAALGRLRREALVGASVSHANLVSVYDIVADGDEELVIVMEYVEGETLRDRLRREGRMDPEAALAVLDGVAAALAAIHALGIVHRDVKPANILLGVDGVVKLADLGIATSDEHTQITSAGAVMGTFSYMAPELLAGEPASRATDLYAFAAVAFEALGGRRARTEPNPVALAHALATGPPPDLREAWPGAPPAAAKVLRDGMSRAAGDRPPTASELVERLRRAFEPGPRRAGRVNRAADRVQPSHRHLGIAAAPRRHPAPARVEEPRRGRKRTVALLALVAATLLAGIAIAASSGGRTTPTRMAPGAVHALRPVSGPTPAGAAASTSSTSPGAGTSPVTSTGGETGATVPTRSAGAAPFASSSIGDPVATVKSFYRLSAAHSFEAAWGLADPSFRAQLGGRTSFEAGQAATRSVSFGATRVVSRDTTSATVALTDTSVHTDGAQHCSGTVALVRARSGWLLHRIAISCR